jgi:hypothetical protein
MLARYAEQARPGAQHARPPPTPLPLRVAETQGIDDALLRPRHPPIAAGRARRTVTAVVGGSAPSRTPLVRTSAQSSSPTRAGRPADKRPGCASARAIRGAHSPMRLLRDAPALVEPRALSAVRLGGDPMTVSAAFDVAGRRRSLAAMPGHHAGRAPRNKGQRCPADPPTVEEIIAVMGQTADDRHGARLRAASSCCGAAGCASRRPSRHERGRAGRAPGGWRPAPPDRPELLLDRAQPALDAGVGVERGDDARRRGRRGPRCPQAAARPSGPGA